jgi:hypothetical protein
LRTPSTITLLAVVISFVACDPARGRKAREFSRIDSVVRQLQQAENGRKEPFIEALSQVKCEQLCPFRDSCLSAYRSHQLALSGLGRARAASNAGHDLEAAANLTQAHLTLQEAREKTEDCARRQGDLLREWRR